jgi:regulation of enolase protein 1 (concanavalin A-like superfamily)
VGAVVTHGSSDWSVAPVPDWHGRVVRIRVSRAGDALTVRAGLDGGELRLVRVAPFPEGRPAEAGPYVCAPTRPGLTVRFTDWSTGLADASLH